MISFPFEVKERIMFNNIKVNSSFLCIHVIFYCQSLFLPSLCKLSKQLVILIKSENVLDRQETKHDEFDSMWIKMYKSSEHQTALKISIK